MGERIIIILGDPGNVGVVLFSNSSHPYVDAEKILRKIVAGCIGFSDLAVKLLAVTYPSTMGNNIEGGRVFSVDVEPGDHGKVLRVSRISSGLRVVDEGNVNFQVKMVRDGEGWSSAPPTAPGLYAIIEPVEALGVAGKSIISVYEQDGVLVGGMRRLEHFSPGTLWYPLPPAPEGAKGGM